MVQAMTARVERSSARLKAKGTKPLFPAVREIKCNKPHSQYSLLGKAFDFGTPESRAASLSTIALPLPDRDWTVTKKC
eukprot:2923133-Rhodomonas_salina.2